MPSVSFIIPLHNRAAELPQTLDALIAQTDADWEAIVVDDHSTDGARDVAQGYASRDARIRVAVLLDPQRGAPSGRNLGVALADGEFVVFLDSDDLVDPTCVAERVAFMRANPSLDFAVWRCQLFREQPGDLPFLWNADTDGDDLDRLLNNDVPWQTTSPIWRQASLAKFALRNGQFWTESALSGQDWEFHVRAVAAGLRYERVAKVDCHWRVASEARDSIGKSSFIGTSHVRGRLETIDRTYDALAALPGVLTRERRRAFAALYFRSLETLADRVSRRLARAEWRRRRRRRDLALSADEARAFDRYLFRKRWPALAMGARIDMARTWPADLLVRRGKWFNVAPADADRAPALSVVTSVYNNAEFVEAAVESILGQSMRDFEFIIIDDGSTDGSGELLQRYADSDARVRLVRRANKGLTVSLNEGLAMARGEFVARMDADDIADRRRFELQLGYLREHPDCVALGTRVELIDPFDVPLERPLHSLEHEQIDAELLAGSGWALVHPTVVFRRDALLRAGGYREQYNGVEDFELFLRLAESGRLANLPDVLLQYRQHLGSVNHTKFAKQRTMKLAVLGEAYARRGLSMPDAFDFKDRTHVDVADQHQFWGWIALKRGRIEAARRHAWRTVRARPASIESWRLLRSAIRGH